MAIPTTSDTAVALSNQELAFFAKLGARIAQLRKEQGITQVQPPRVRIVAARIG